MKIEPGKTFINATGTCVRCDCTVKLEEADRKLILWDSSYRDSWAINCPECGYTIVCEH